MNTVLATLTVLGQLAALVLLFVWLRGKPSSLRQFVGRFSLPFAFAISLVSTLGSLYFSELKGFEPCVLCWYQRILIYPQVLLLGLALWRKEKVIVDYVLGLSIIGVVIAAYQYYGQMFNPSSLPFSIDFCSSFTVFCRLRTSLRSS